MTVWKLVADVRLEFLGLHVHLTWILSTVLYGDVLSKNSRYQKDCGLQFNKLPAKWRIQLESAKACEFIYHAELYCVPLNIEVILSTSRKILKITYSPINLRSIQCVTMEFEISIAVTSQQLSSGYKYPHDSFFYLFWRPEANVQYGK
jgi:hypothetical protein